MKKTLFYIIIISQVWLGIGTTCVHLLLPECEFVELLGEEEREKEKEMEKEVEKINISDELSNADSDSDRIKNYQMNVCQILGRVHLVNTTPPPKLISFLS